MLSQAIKSSNNQINNQQDFFQSPTSSSSSPSSPSASKDHQNKQLYQHHHHQKKQHIWQQQAAHQHQYHRRFHWHQKSPKSESQSSSVTIFSLVNNQYQSRKGVNLHYHHNSHLLTKLFQSPLRPSMNFLLTVLILGLIARVPSTLGANLPGTTANANNNNLITNPYEIINSDIKNVYDREITLNSNSLGNLDNDFSSSTLTHSRPVLSPKLPESSSTLLSQSKSSSSSLSFPLSSSSTQPSAEPTLPPVSPGSYYSFIPPHHATQLSHYYLQIPKPQQSLPPTTSTSTKQQSTNNNNNNAKIHELNIKTPADFESLFHRIARRSSRPYDVPQIECPVSEDGVDRFACPTPNKEGRYRCIEDHELCNGFIACPNAEDEDRKLCMFYKTTKAHLDVLADAMLRMVRGRF